MSKTHTFQVKPSGNDSDELYWQVHVCPDKRSMYRLFRKLNETSDKKTNFAAIVMPQRTYHVSIVKGKDVLQPSLGHVLFYAKNLPGEIIAHEAVHMATSYLRRCRKSLRLTGQIDDAEELLAYCVGRCAAQIANKLHELKIWK